jgi:hypothetical protein
MTGAKTFILGPKWQNVSSPLSSSVGSVFPVAPKPAELKRNAAERKQNKTRVTKIKNEDRFRIAQLYTGISIAQHAEHLLVQEMSSAFFQLTRGSSMVRSSNLVMSSICLLALVSGCNSNNSNQSAAAPAPTQNALAWTLAYNSQCTADVPDDQCVAKYGFSINSDGTTFTGPSASGRLKPGKKLTADEVKSVQNALTQAGGLAALESNRSESTVDQDPADTQDTITLIKHGKKIVLAQSNSTKFTFRGTNADSSKALYQSVMALAVQYYVAPTPCQEAADDFVASYTTLQTCHTDSDCAYINSNYDPIPPETSPEFVATDDCTVITPMSVGNRELVIHATDELQTGYTKVSVACDDHLYRAGCISPTYFPSSALAPVCKQNHCQANN